MIFALSLSAFAQKDVNTVSERADCATFDQHFSGQGFVGNYLLDRVIQEKQCDPMLGNTTRTSFAIKVGPNYTEYIDANELQYDLEDLFIGQTSAGDIVAMIPSGKENIILAGLCHRHYLSVDAKLLGTNIGRQVKDGHNVFTSDYRMKRGAAQHGDILGGTIEFIFTDNKNIILNPHPVMD